MSDRVFQFGESKRVADFLKAVFGMTRVLESSSSFAISPSTIRATNAGKGKIVGRPSTLPKVFVNSRLLTGLGGRAVHRAFEFFVRDRVMDSPHDIIHRDPTPVLLAMTDNAADTKLERRQHFLKGSSLRTQNDTDPQMHDSDSL